MSEPKENLDAQLFDVRGSIMAKFDKLIEQADGIEQELAYAEVNRDEANARVKALLAHIGQMRDRIGHWNAGHVSDADMMQGMFKWSRTDLNAMMQEAVDAVN